MSNNYFEKFVQQNRVEFDSETPANKVWENIAKNLPVEKKAKVFTLKDIYKWSAAAAVFFILITSAYFLWIHKPVVTPEVVNIEKPVTNPSTNITTPQVFDSNNNEELGSIPEKDLLVKTTPKIPDDRDKVSVKKEDASENMFEIIQAKQAELKKLTKEQPYLYKEFAADLNSLESSYGVLKKQLKQTPNTDVIIKAMMQNLQLQAELLGRQLNIINNIKKSNNNEKNNSRFN
ncbi:MAG: hypothetical protein KA319_04000 [Ferruginibacter sp.]|nr:hypothetical protein [Ferruginibacter sp.]